LLAVDRFLGDLATSPRASTSGPSRFAAADHESSVGRLTIRGLPQESSLPFFLERIAAQGLLPRYPDR
jgi:hypothetical protein